MALIEKRKKCVLLFDGDQEYQKAFLMAVTIQGTTLLAKCASTTDEASGLVLSNFRAGIFLVVGESIGNNFDSHMVLKCATQQAKKNHFQPVIIANTGNEKSNQELLKAGCTHTVDRKSGLLHFLEHFGESRSSRDLRALEVQ
jgi:hypothetical protein